MMQKITRIAMNRFLKYQATDLQVLEVGVPAGAGYGHLFPNHTTLDINPLRKPDITSDVCKMPFEDGTWPVVVMIEVLEHLTDPAAALAEIYRVLKPGGKLVLTTRFFGPVHDAPHDYFRFTYFGLEYLLKGWTNVTIVPDLTTMQTLGTFFQRIAFQTEVRGGKLTKVFLFVCAWCFSHMEWIIKKEYGDIGRTTPYQGGILTSGYHVVAYKPDGV